MQPRTKRFTHWLVLILIILASAEILGCAAWSVREGYLVLPRGVRSFLKDAGGLSDRVRGDAEEQESENAPFRIIHPYAGYEDPQAPIEEAFDSIRNSGAMCVLILGGSVAEQLEGVQKRMELKLSEALDRDVRIVNVAIGGYKQPQQMTAFGYLLALGERCDIVLNVDGFNEYDLVLDNAEEGTNPWYPYKRLWSTPVKGFKSIPAQALAWEILQLREAQKERATNLYNSVFGRSYLVTFVWRVWDTSTDAYIAELQLEIADQGDTAEQNLAADGPEYNDSSDILIRKSANLWSESSFLMHQMAQGHDMQYFHFLQPNQYVPGSKKFMSETEKRMAMRDERHTEVVPRIYALFRQRGEQLLGRGVQFYDMSDVFLDEEERTYRDLDTHLSPLGNEILGDAIVKRVLEGM